MMRAVSRLSDDITKWWFQDTKQSCVHVEVDYLYWYDARIKIYNYCDDTDKRIRTEPGGLRLTQKMSGVQTTYFFLNWTAFISFSPGIDGKEIGQVAVINSPRRCDKVQTSSQDIRGPNFVIRRVLHKASQVRETIYVLTSGIVLFWRWACIDMTELLFIYCVIGVWRGFMGSRRMLADR